MFCAAASCFTVGEIDLSKGEIEDLFNRSGGVFGIEDLENNIIAARKAGVSEKEIAKSLKGAVNLNDKITQRNVIFASLDLESKALAERGFNILGPDKEALKEFGVSGMTPSSMLNPSGNLVSIGAKRDRFFSLSLSDKKVGKYGKVPGSGKIAAP